MIYRFRHVTRYRFSQPVTLAPHTFRLKPRQDGYQKLRHFSIDITPSPAGLTTNLDVAGHGSLYAWFTGKTDRMDIQVKSEVETTRSNSFDFLLEYGAQELPVPYRPAVALELQPYLRSADRTSPAPEVMAFAADCAKSVDYEPLPFLRKLCERLHQRIERRSRLDGPPLSPEETLQQSSAACRDLAMLSIACCRSQGLAARFVSGYHEGDPEISTKELHAWVEVYLPGGGWRGFDPSLGLFVADRHVALAAAADHILAAPVHGIYSGDATSTLEAEIDLTVL